MAKTLKPHPYLEQYEFIPFAHRGGTSSAPENTLRAFSDAYAVGFRFLETDVHASSDGVLFAFHDNDLTRTCGSPHKINEMTAAEVSRQMVDGTDAIPTLAELLSSFPDAYFNIDCKADDALEPLVRALSTRNVLERVCIGSFSDRRLRAIRNEFGSKVCTSAGPREVVAMTVGATRGLMADDGPHCLQIPQKQGPINLASNRFIDRAHQNGLRVHYWTIDEDDQMHALIDCGADGIMTDRPSVLRNVLEQRSMWQR